MIHIPHEFPEIEYLAPYKPELEPVFSAKAFAPFYEGAISFFQKLSTQLLKNQSAKDYPDVISYAFWCRDASLRVMKKNYVGKQLRLGRGILFHIAPSNVPVNFAYSMTVGLLAGNANVVRVPTSKFPQVDIICSAIRELIETAEFQSIKNHIVLLRYEKNDVITNYFSANCDVRLIWGGDKTISDIRRSPLSARAFDLTFADRYSLCVIDSASYIDSADPSRVALDFYNDTYLFDQNACTAPHLVVWLGDTNNVKKAQELFWNSLHKVVANRYELQPVSAVDKLADAYRFAALNENCEIYNMVDNAIVRVRLNRIESGIEDARSTCGYFYEYEAKNLNEIAPLINRKFQTLAYFGVDAILLHDFIEKNRPNGIDRIVPIGRTLDFSLVWDGYDLICMLSRVVQVY